ncbi:hypothetical protein F5J12DRAFT_781406 [Pisolithus orientalis]|uniref:uncharacterized protein n=1 Tax=Pisolithus orientalis TaxID=936130 RepID=UPI002224D15F|nr:uncharacterized protein F5J12DRAFT_781406 [Pisolithus orientalis]KAI6012459.1 hypothetical protein F5J12DRAFT_781406 [Pisolithus orientalis]
MALTSDDALPSRLYQYHDLSRPGRPSTRSGISHYIFRRQFIASCAALAIVSVAALALLTLVTTPTQLQSFLTAAPVTEVEDAQSYLLGPPTQSLRDNLRNDTKYITSWLNAGWISFHPISARRHLLYPSAMFLTSHVLSKALRIPVLEWDQVKDVNSSSLDELGCWAVWPIVEQGAPPRDSFPHSKAKSGQLARLAYPEARETAISQPPDPSPQHQVSLPPDDHLLCYDYLYYTAVTSAWEWNWDYSPVWRFVGKHMHWNATLEKLADEHARRAMNISDGEPTPPFISIHMRHGDFRIYCNEFSDDQCFVPLPAVARRVAEVQQELFDKKGINVSHVIMTSDERDPNWWAEVRKYGWTWVDYAAERTVEKYGRWYPVLLDAILQSRGAGFVGTEYSTMSLLALRRVQDWDDGAVRMAKWGRPGADDH